MSLQRLWEMRDFVCYDVSTVKLLFNIGSSCVLILRNTHKAIGIAYIVISTRRCDVTITKLRSALNYDVWVNRCSLFRDTHFAHAYRSQLQRSVLKNTFPTVPLKIWERHAIVYPDMLSLWLFASFMLKSGWCATYSACMEIKGAKQPACWLHPEWSFRYETGCSPRLFPELPLLVLVLEVHSREFLLEKPVCCRWPADHLGIAGGTARETDPLWIRLKYHQTGSIRILETGGHSAIYIQPRGCV